MSTSKSTYHHGDLRNALIDAAASAVDDGSASSLSLSLREVARRAGVSHAAAYKHFEDKRDLLRAVALRGFDDLRVRLEEVTTSRASGIGEIAAAYVGFALEHPTAFRLMFDRSLCRPLGEPDELEAAGAQAQAALTEFIERRYALRGQLADGAMFAAWSQMHGIATLALETPALKALAPEQAIELARRSSTYLSLRQPGLL